MSTATLSSLSETIGRALVQTASDAIVATDRAGTIRFWNPGAERIFGFSASEAVGQSLDIIIPENLRARHWQGWEQTIATGHSHYDSGAVLSVPALTAQGQRISVEFTILLQQDAGGRVEGVIAVMRDVSARFEELRALRHQLAALSAQRLPAG